VCDEQFRMPEKDADDSARRYRTCGKHKCACRATYRG
jgi:hypothetical protein